MARETGFDEVFDSQATFRALLGSLSRPGSLRSLPPRRYPSAPDGFCPPALSILKTMCDHRVCFSVGSSAGRQEWISYLVMNLSTPFRPVEEADYVLFNGESFEQDFTRLKRGTLEYPERSATALVCVQSLSSAESTGSRGLRVSGPGVKGSITLAVAGFDARYLEERSAANRFYPMGIDLLLVDPEGNVAGLPRTSVVETG
ncbi:MAG TPA: phosphonate C-P lyase system protein PhnH [Spirochaetia bacterium]|nr:phosphonate C-P lyase system protein PhnH [Spirochaetia bacterium]